MPDIEPPDLSEIRNYKGIHALCTVSKKGELLKATHFASVLIGGPHPVWGIWNASGKFLRYAGSRAQIEEVYPKLAWRRVMATWGVVDPHHKTLAIRREELRQAYGNGLPNGPRT